MLAITQRSSFPVLSIFWISLVLRLFFLGHHDLLAEEAYYWNYSTHLDFGYLDHPPLIAALIKISTTLLGLNEFAVRFPTLVCWGLTAYFIYRWSELIQIGCGQFSVLLLSILPFFFIDSCVITPDMPMLAAWAAGLYFLYRALCLHEARAWYAVGISLGLGLLAKYAIALLIMAAGLFLLSHREQRVWLRRKEPYLAALIMLAIFSPVIYWNAIHNWISFSFQSTQRIRGAYFFSLHELLGLLVLFLTPLGILGLVKLCKRSETRFLPQRTVAFLQMHTWVPLLVYAIFSCFRGTKFNWIGPGLLAIVPWLAFLMYQNTTVLQKWIRTAPFLIGAYTLILVCISYGKPTFLNKLLFTKMVAWEQLTQDVYQVAAKISTPQTRPVLLPLDKYGIASELNFYQTKQWRAHPNLKPFSVFSQGLMYRFWNTENLHGQTIIRISQNQENFEKSPLPTTAQPLSSITVLWGTSQGQETPTVPYFYQIARLQ